ncbi:MAG: 4Fe-4S binding protein, partial [Clostridia bacterium]|nr:4Fe-4S binding protein [Clostridia bacterium]
VTQCVGCGVCGQLCPFGAIGDAGSAKEGNGK